MSGVLVIIQTHVQAYRLGVFDELHRRTGGRLSVWAGLKSFSPTTGSPARERSWHRVAENRFLWDRRFLWQSGLWGAALAAEVCVVEFNPRILSNWPILFLRQLLRRPTYVWGHLHPRAGNRAPTRMLRYLMLALASGANLYTHREATIMARVLPWKRIIVSPNAVMWDADCGWNGQSRRRRFVFVARLIAEKKPLLALEAFARVAAELPDFVRLDFVGGGYLEGPLRERVAELGLTERVGIHGEIYDPSILRQYYDEAIAAVSPGYVGLSATQAFGFGVPMLIAREERHSVEIALCEEGFNCVMFRSNSVEDFAAKMMLLAREPGGAAYAGEAICQRLRASYTLNRMCDGFMQLFAPVASRARTVNEPIHIGIAWMGLPYYAARVIREVRDRHPGWRLTIVSSRVDIPYEGVEDAAGGRVHWVDSSRPFSWQALGRGVPDLVLVTSWPHTAYNWLAREARRDRGAAVVCMVDNYFRGTPKQLAGYVYFRLFLRRLYSAMWVPGIAGHGFMRYLGVDRDSIYQGLYCGDPDLFGPPEDHANRQGLLFVGQLVRRKGLRPLAAVAARRAAAQAPLPLTILGAGALAPELRDAGLVVEGFKQPRELAGYYKKASALILPSRIDHWGVVVHEAALSGCLLIATRQCGSCADLIEHGVNGYIMDDSSIAEIEAAIAWWQSLSPAEIARGRDLSLARSRQFGPMRWADTLDELVERFVPGGAKGGNAA